MNHYENSSSLISENIIKPYSNGILDGLSFAVKDNIDIENEPTGNGSKSWSKLYPKPTANAVCVEQLLSSGATCIGKAQLDELAYSLLGINEFYKIPLNKKAPDRVAGGSSSGSASLVASGVVDFALGTDTGGSVRVPASNCGIWGYRPSHGLISMAGVTPLAPSFDTVGVLARDGDILNDVISVLLAESGTSLNQDKSIIFLDDVFDMCDDVLLKAISPLTDQLQKHYSSKRIPLDEIINKPIDCSWLFENAGLLMSAEIWNVFGGWVSNIKPELSQSVASNFENYAKKACRQDIQKALYETKYFANKLNSYLQANNVICYPTTVDLAPKIDAVISGEIGAGGYYPRAMGVMALAGFSRTPVITIPLVDVGGVPIGISFMAGYGEDLMLSNLCKQLTKLMLT